MKTSFAFLLGLSLAGAAFAQPAATSFLSDKSVREAFGDRDGGLIVIRCDTGGTFTSNPDITGRPFVPCSTFKIWNTLIGLEEGIIKDADATFYKWDGQERTIADWNKDLTLRQAFRASCVPAYQELARKIGLQRMQGWIEKLGYGNQDLSAGIDQFWLPRAGVNNILVSPKEQAMLLRRLLGGQLPVRRTSIATLRDIMKVETSSRGTLYGKTGSGARSSDEFDMGWFVGFLEHEGKEYSYACILLGPGLSGKDAKGIVERVFKETGML